jgi:nucleoid-associated protein YgaU
MTTLMHACGMAVGVLILTLCYSAVAWADPVAQASSSPTTPVTVTVQVPPAASGMTTTVTVKVSSDATGQATQVTVTTDAPAATHPVASAAVGDAGVTTVPVDAQHPFTWDFASMPAAPGCGPHPSGATPGCPQQGSASARAPSVAQTSSQPAQAPLSPSPSEVSTDMNPSLTYTVQPGDTLVKIAARFYGDDDSHAFSHIAEVNTGQVMNDGRTFSDPSVIQPGWMLVIPEPTYSIADEDGERVYTVQSGDTLAGIAARLLGDANRWPEVDAINQEAQLVAGPTLAGNPDLIWPGMQLRLPAVSSSSPLVAAASVAAEEQP